MGIDDSADVESVMVNQLPDMEVLTKFSAQP